MEFQIVFAVSITIFFEGIIYFFMDKYNFRTFFALFGVNALSNMAMNITLSFIEQTSLYYAILITWEVLTILGEAFLFFYTSKKPLWYAFLASTTANIISWAIGYNLNYFKLFQEKGALIIGSIVLFTLSAGLLALSFLLSYRHWNDDRKDDTSSH